MTIFLTLTTAGSDSGPFNLYSDSDGYTVPFDTNVFKSSLEAGYSTTAPDGTQTVKVVSTGACINSTYITLVLADCTLAGYVEEITTTTTTTSAPTTTSTTTVACECFQIQANISQLDLDDATGNTEPANDNIISLAFLNCDGIYSVQNYTVAGTNIIYPSGCTNDPLNILNFRYFKNNVEITSVVSTASLSSFCCV